MAWILYDALKLIRYLNGVNCVSILSDNITIEIVYDNTSD